MNFLMALNQIERIITVWAIAIFCIPIMKKISNRLWIAYSVYAIAVAAIYTALEVFVL